MAASLCGPTLLAALSTQAGACDNSTREKHETSAFDLEFDVTVDRNSRPGSPSVGLALSFASETYAVVTAVIESGLVADWNDKAIHEQRVIHGDVLVSANGVLTRDAEKVVSVLRKADVVSMKFRRSSAQVDQALVAVIHTNKESLKHVGSSSEKLGGFKTTDYFNMREDGPKAVFPEELVVEDCGGKKYMTPTRAFVFPWCSINSNCASCDSA
eukprot:TRINITY_DN1896_c0_g1_i2.p1 TRINITY_DN1896_c0_g1~~TRINITY_DN1896_c0_g1_i2.p1  ORF type:complete len:240 (-),score=40.40 TRINITY_DN1896_c0_g1_i2:366-1007(-)